MFLRILFHVKHIDYSNMSNLNFILVKQICETSKVLIVTYGKYFRM